MNAMTNSLQTLLRLKLSRIREPAKMSWALAKRLMAHLRECWPTVTTVCDPMAGVGTVGIAAAYAGYQAVLGELEHDFSVMMAGQTCPGVTKRDWVRFWGKSRHKQTIYQWRWCPRCRQGLPYQHDGRIPYSIAHYFQGTLGRHRNTLQALKKPMPVLWRHDARHMPLHGAGAIVSSPPYAQQVHHNGGVDETKFKDANRSIGKHYQGGLGGYGYHPAQLGNLRAVVTSPPFSNIEPYQDKAFRLNDGRKALPQGQDGYGSHLMQLGNDTGTDYWSAMDQVYRECARILAPVAPMLLVLKGYVQKGQYVDLPQQTAELLEQCGFRVVHWHYASLQSREAQLDIFGGETRRERKSFFRRLAEKNGAPPINHEVVLCAERDR